MNVKSAWCLVFAAICSGMLAVLFSAATTAAPSTSIRASHITLRAQNEPVRAVLMRLARSTGANLTVADGVTGYVTVDLHAVTLPQALRAILEPLGASYRFQDGIYTIEAGSSTTRTSATTPVVIPLSVVTAKRAATTLRSLFPQASLREDARANALVIVATPADVQAMRAVLQGIDIRDPTLPATEALALLAVIEAGPGSVIESPPP